MSSRVASAIMGKPPRNNKSAKPDPTQNAPMAAPRDRPSARRLREADDNPTPANAKVPRAVIARMSMPSSG